MRTVRILQVSDTVPSISFSYRVVEVRGVAIPIKNLVLFSSVSGRSRL